MDRVHIMTEGLIDDKQDGFRSGKGSMDLVFTQKLLG